MSSFLRLLAALSSLFVFLVPGLADPPDSKKPEKPMTGKMVYYSGNVQGVGFRATASMIARDHPVVGWVKNLDDGRVQMLVEGQPDAIEKFLKAIRDHWKDDIEKVETEDQKPTGKFTRFSIVP
jgi:acylphosphatase